MHGRVTPALFAQDPRFELDVQLALWNQGKAREKVPRSRSPRGDLGDQNTPNKPRYAITPYRRFRGCYKLFLRPCQNQQSAWPMRGREGEVRTYAEVEVGTTVIGNESHCVVLCDVFGVGVYEICVRRHVNQRAVKNGQRAYLSRRATAMAR
jgi:hypothetical protein